MQNRNYFLLFALLVCGAVKAQEVDSAVASVRYSFTHIMDTTQPENPLKENMILYLGKNMSNYTSYDRIERAAKSKTVSDVQNPIGSLGTPTSVTVNGAPADLKKIDQSTIQSVSVNNGAITIITNPNMAFINSYYKDQSAAKLAYMASANGKIFSVEEKIPVIEWAITPETKEIQGLPCQKATGDFKGRSYEAWFCSQLPYNNGPWKLGGLPGLIIEAYDTKKEVMFTFTSFENASGAQVAIAVPADVIKTTPKEYKQYQEAMQRDRAAMSGAASGSAPGGANIVVRDVVRVGSVPAGTMTGPDGKPVKIRRMNNPVEKEQK